MHDTSKMNNICNSNQTEFGFFGLQQQNRYNRGSIDNGNGRLQQDAAHHHHQQQLLRTRAAFPYDAPVPFAAPSSSSSSSPSSSKTTTTTTLTTPHLLPTASTVVIGKGSVPKKASGNRKLREMVLSSLGEYASAGTKISKSTIVTNIYYEIETSCRREGSDAPFLRYDRREGYSRIGETLGREKITSTFRDILSDRYRSSSKNKVARRRRENQKKAERRLESVLSSTSSVLHLQQQQRSQQHQLQRIPERTPSSTIVPILPSSSSQQQQQRRPALTAVIPFGCPSQRLQEEQRKQPQEQQQQQRSNKERTSFLDLCSKLFDPSGGDNNNDAIHHHRSPTGRGEEEAVNANASSSSSSLDPAPLFFEFDPSFLCDLEPVPIPELDHSSMSSCSCQHDHEAADPCCRRHGNRRYNHQQ